jgi:hypothetical protein
VDFDKEELTEATAMKLCNKHTKKAAMAEMFFKIV